MKIEVKNLGPIKHGTIDLDKKVTVFVGYNNSGKTYMSQLMWILSRRLSLFDGTEVGLNVINSEQIALGPFCISEDIIDSFVAEYVKLLKEFIPHYFNVESNYFAAEKLDLKFSGHIDDLKKGAFGLLVGVNDNYKFQDYYTFEKSENSLEIIIQKKKLSRPVNYVELGSVDEIANLNIKHIRAIDKNEDNSRMLKTSILVSLYELILSDISNVFFLPANRVFYPSYYKYIYSIAKEEKDRIGNILKRSDDIEAVKAFSKTPYTQMVDDLVQHVYNLNKNLEIRPVYTDLLNELEEIIGGKIIFKSAEGIAPIEFHLKLDNGKELDMYMASSSANQLTTLYLYLKYWAEKENNFLIIDEPEENLHPENQIKLVNLLMKFADRNNNKVLITTHSPLITDLINNYANLSYLKENGVSVNALIKDNSANMADINNIKHEDYGVYFFNGDSIKEYEIDNYGAYFEDFQAAENKVKDVSNSLKESIYNLTHPNA